MHESTELRAEHRILHWSESLIGLFAYITANGAAKRSSQFGPIINNEAQYFISLFSLLLPLQVSNSDEHK